ncbi:hypothetical protein KM043_007046 [Ampulex compressa]|nr:hypothetical protein KM043_007046 [Ampulex compressa]
MAAMERGRGPILPFRLERQKFATPFWKRSRGGHNSGGEAMTSEPSSPPPRNALKDSSANLMILQRSGLQSAARRASPDTDPSRSRLLVSRRRGPSSKS